MIRPNLSIPVIVLALWQGYMVDQFSHAQVSVQLPTFRVTGVSTTVLVPDRGGVYLGGVTNSSIGQNSFGSPFGGHLPGLQRNLGNRSFGRSTASSNFWVGATIIDHTEIDRALLAEADQRRNLRRAGAGQKLTRVPHENELVDAKPTVIPQSGLAVESQRVGIYLARAERAEAKGQPQVAKIFYQRIAQHGTAAQKRKARTRLASIDSANKQ